MRTITTLSFWRRCWLVLLTAGILLSSFGALFRPAISSAEGSVPESLTVGKWVHKGLIKASNSNKSWYFVFYDETASTYRFKLQGAEDCSLGGGGDDEHLNNRPTQYLSIPKSNPASATYLKIKRGATACNQEYANGGTVTLNTQNRSLFWQVSGSNEIKIWHNGGSSGSGIIFKKKPVPGDSTNWKEYYVRSDEDPNENPCVDAIAKTKDGTWVFFPMMVWDENNKGAWPYASGAQSEGYHYLLTTSPKNRQGSIYNNCRVSAHRVPNVYLLGVLDGGYGDPEQLGSARDFDADAKKVNDGPLGNDDDPINLFTEPSLKNLPKYMDIKHDVEAADDGNRLDWTDGAPSSGYNWVITFNLDEGKSDGDKNHYQIRMWDNRSYGMDTSSNHRLIRFNDDGLSAWKWGYEDAGGFNNDGYKIEKGIAQVESEDANAAGDTTDVNLNEDDTNDGPENGDSTTSCNVEGVGWIVCPVMNFIAKINDAAFGLLSGMLTVEPKLLSDPDTKTAWDQFRNIANVAFVIAFLVIIYSQLTGAGITNYGIKKMLPKLIVAAVLVNISYYLCQIAVDLSNIVGSSIYSFFKDIPTSAGGSATESSFSWVGVMAAVLTGAVILLLLGSVLGGAALLAFALVVLILVARKAILILLIVISPLAFVAYLLPNTNQWFKKWWKVFSTLLMVFPVVGVIFGASFLAARIVANGGDDLTQLTALGIMAIPLFAVPVALKGAMAATGAVGAKLSGWQDRAMKGAGSKGRDRIKRRAENLEARAADYEGRGGRFVRAAGGYRNRRAFRRKSIETDTARRQQEALTSHILANPASYEPRQIADATASLHHEFDEEVKRQKTTMSGLDHDALMAIMRDKNASEETRSAAAGTIMGRDYRAGHLQALEAARDMKSKGDGAMESVQKQMAYDMKSKPWALGDQAAGQLQIGQFGAKPAPGSTAPDFSSKDLTEQIKERVGNKLSGANLAAMNPDELRVIHKLATTPGELTPEQKSKLDAAIMEIHGNDTLRGNVKGEAAKVFNNINPGYTL